MPSQAPSIGITTMHVQTAEYQSGETGPFQSAVHTVQSADHTSVKVYQSHVTSKDSEYTIAPYTCHLPHSGSKAQAGPVKRLLNLSEDTSCDPRATPPDQHALLQDRASKATAMSTPTPASFKPSTASKRAKENLPTVASQQSTVACKDSSGGPVLISRSQGPPCIWCHDTSLYSLSSVYKENLDVRETSRIKLRTWIVAGNHPAHPGTNAKLIGLRVIGDIASSLVVASHDSSFVSLSMSKEKELTNHTNMSAKRLVGRDSHSSLRDKHPTSQVELCRRAGNLMQAESASTICQCLK